ncbi:3-dehydroquinate synthase [Siphonobacter sp. BAB-5405]|uniref:3-dehydroquinate synthase n=1 Tax=Siphonobacter sp. BAB-5405 TaxID=1864825 RepID=UPI000C7FC1AC|nr:3-dehydroquinate synthase [Siphonobacter sp. BAB-5405]PMD95619.1 3-dehydroquinate synthase [Siphonobacter sp. BAB-5405]
METIQQRFSVTFSYPVIFTQQLFDPQNTKLRDFLSQYGERDFRKKIFFCIDSGVLAAHPTLQSQITHYFESVPTLSLVPEWLIIPGGEAAKNAPALFDQIVEAVDQYGIDRHSFVAAIGGGAVLDLVGYAAAVSHRGVKHIRIPTTILSQNDSGVGVKNGINYRGKKNFLGTFAPPVAVFNDTDFLRTLDDRDWRSGISEAIKVALIKDKVFFEWLEANAKALAQRDEAAMQYLIHRCAELHMQHISGGDPFESGSARPLDFGHWAAHKLEYLTHFEVRHGEAVAIGIALDTYYSQLTGRLSETDTQRVIQVLHELGFELYHPALAEQDSVHLINGLREFQEHLGGRLTITLLDAIGVGVEVHEMDAVLIQKAVVALQGETV